jgi:thiol:disulfide interchange protein DsbD
MVRFTLTDASVQRRISGALLLKADVTRNGSTTARLLKRFGLFGPPGTLCLRSRWQGDRRHRVVGFQSTSRFLETLRQAGP